MTDRMRRVDEAIRQVVAESVATYISDPRVGFVTITDVRTSPDLRRSDVYVSVLGDGKAKEAAIAGLESAHGRIQAEINRQMRLKRTPTLNFVIDETPEQAARVERILGAENSREESR